MNKTILVVDDEQDVLAVVGQRLSTEGFNVLKCDNGVDAVSIAQARKPDLIILDIAMPKMDGSEVAGELKDNPATQDIPVIFLTALLSKGMEKEHQHLVGGNVMFAKPYDIQELLAEVKKQLQLHCGA